MSCIGIQGTRYKVQQWGAPRLIFCMMLFRASSAKSSIASHGLVGTAEKSFLKPKEADVVEDNVPSLDEFDTEIDIYRTAKDEITALQDYQDVGWMRIDMKPIKQVLITYASKWMWTYTKYLSDRISGMLDSLDEFLKRIEPEIESITGEERDTASFMKMMRLFNEVSAQQSEMDGNFAAMHRTVLLVKKYGQKLPDKTQKLFDAAPSRWNNLKTKVSLAKQRLGPRIQEESDSITRDLESFGNRVQALNKELDSSDVYNRECSLGDSWVLIDNFMQRLDVLENEAQDLIELQELLEASVVNFSILPQCRHDLSNLRQVWEMVRNLDTQHTEWKRHRWQKMNTEFLHEECNGQLESIKELPEEVFMWDVYMGMTESITSIKACLPLIDDLSNPAMRTRHWKQLVRVTGGAVQIDNDALKRMTLGELLSLGLLQHVDDVRAIVQRAVKDLSIEQSLKTYEEVWLSKIFEMREHTRSRLMLAASKTNTAEKEEEQETPEAKSEMSESQQAGRGAGSQMASRNQRTTSRVSNHSSLSRARRTSVSSLPTSLLALVDESGVLMLLTSTEPIFEELESHQMALQAMQSSSAAGSFLDEVMKWQKRLQAIEAVLTSWLEVQEKWVELEDVYSSQDVTTALPNDSNIFATISRDFKLLMRATEKNPNVLQCCQRKNIHKIMEKMNSSLEMCRKSLLVHLERRRQIFPRFYFLSMEDVLHIVCNGYDLKQVNLYISKLFENIGCLVYNEVDDEDLKFNFLITGVQSHLGEKLPLKQPVQCEGAIETWLGTLVTSIRAALQYQLATATGVEKPVETRSIHSAGARKVQVSQEKRSQSKQQQAKEVLSAYVRRWKEERSKMMSRTGSRNASRQHSRTDVKPPTKQKRVAERRPRATGPRAWILDHVAEVVHLVTQIQITQQIEETVNELDGGNKEALLTSFDKLDKDIKSTVIMLKGLDDKRGADSREKQDIDSHSGKERSGSRTETSSQVGTHRTSNRGSVMDLHGAENPTIPEESSTLKEEESPMEPSTAEPVDTMNLGMIPLVVKKEEESEEEEESEQSELRLMLFPSQIHKISNLIALLAHQRDLLQRLTELKESNENGKVAESLEWKSQMQYLFDTESRIVQAKCLDNTFEYGFEYLGSTMREVITPMTERVFLSLIQAVKANQAGLVMGPAGHGKVNTIAELAKCLGKPLYTFNCSKMTDSFLLHDIFKGFASTGCWICFNNIGYIPESTLSVCAQLMATVSSALQVNRGAVNINSEEIQLIPGAAMFSTFDSSIPVSTTDPQKLLHFNSAASDLPSDVLKQYRLVSFTSPDLKLMIEISLISRGFLNARDIATKVVMLFDMCKQIMGTMAPVSNSSRHLRLDSTHIRDGWSPQVLKFVIQEAAIVLDHKLTLKLAKEEETSSARADDAEEQQNPDEPEAEKHEDEVQEKDIGEILKAEDTLMDESESIVIALQNSFMPRLSDRDASVLATLVKDLWPEVNVALPGGDNMSTVDDSETISAESSRRSSRPGSKMLPSRISRAKSRSVLDIALPTGRSTYRDPATPGAGTLTDRVYLKEEMKERKEISEAISDATKSLGLVTGKTFLSRVLQLAQLSTAHKTIVVTGPPGCGKSECIKTFALAERERQTNVVVQSIFTKSVESHELLGYFEPNSKEWKEGLLTTLLRKLSVPSANGGYDPTEQHVMKILQLDGELDSSQFELMDTILHNDGFVVLANNEKIIVPESLRFIWETENLNDLSPALLSKVGVVCMSSSDVGWHMMLSMWVNKHPEGEQEVIRSFCDEYVDKVVSHLDELTKPPMLAGQAQEGHYRRIIPHSNEAMISTFTTLFEALIAPYSELTELDLERYFNFALMWSFGGTLEYQHRDAFSSWWKSTFEELIDYPEELSIFDYTIDNDTHMWVKWVDQVPAYAGTGHTGIANDAFVHTVSNEQLLYLLGVLTDYGKPVMLIGENGCGKSAIVNERIRSVCSGEVAEVLGLTVNTNRFTSARLLYQRLDDLLEWKHGRTFIPKGNKRLMCFVDDINLAKQHGWKGDKQVDMYSGQTAIEMMRQHVDDGGFYDPDTNMWRYVKSVTYVTTVNPNQAVPKISNRLIRHFAAFGCPYPSHKELETIFSGLLHTHFIRSETTTSSGNTLNGSTAHHLGIHDDQYSQEVQCLNEESFDYVRLVMKVEEDAMRQMLSLIVTVTLELQDRLRTMFLPTAERCHYIFTMKDLGNIFRNLCLSLKPTSDRTLILQLWQNECEWVYGRRMVSEVDGERFSHAMMTAIRKDFSNPEHIELLSQKEKPIYCNLIEQDSGIVTAGNVIGNQKNVDPNEIPTNMVKPMYDVPKVRNLVERAAEEYNKTHPRIKISLYRIVLEQVCRLAQIIASPHQGAHVTMVAEGSPGRCYVMANLAAHLCGYVTFKINPSPVSSPIEYKIDSFKSDLVTAYTRAGVKGEKILFLLEEDELLDDDFIVYLTEFIVGADITHLFTSEEMTTIINSIRTEVTQAGLTYTREVAWDFFVNTVRKNFRVCFVATKGGSKFQRRCREYPQFTKHVSFMWFPHWTKLQLIKHAAYHLKFIKWMDKVQRENIAHLLATMHIVLRQQDGQEQGTGQYHHVTNTSYEKFVERFITMAESRHDEIHSAHDSHVSMNKQVQTENQLAARLQRTLEHERQVLEERKQGTCKMLSQIGQDTAITEQQVRIVKAQMEKIAKLKKLLPEYQVAHERAVYKAIAIVNDTKKVVREIDIESLAELRGMQKPIIDIEDLMAAVIMILKNPQADLTWQKGAKRQMANIERFIEELITFDDNAMPEQTLALVEPYLKKPSFDLQTMERKSENKACVSLCKWVTGVCRYHRIMISKVKPLHKKVEETTQAIDNAEHKMSVLENKRKALEIRLNEMAKGFEEATIDKNTQEDKTIKMDKQLETAARLRKVLKREQIRIQQILNSLPQREASINGSVAMAAAFATFL